MTDRLIDLETRLAFLDDTVRALNDAVARHSQQLERLERAVVAVQDEMRRLSAGQETGRDEVPPHY